MLVYRFGIQVLVNMLGMPQVSWFLVGGILIRVCISARCHITNKENATGKWDQSAFLEEKRVLSSGTICIRYMVIIIMALVSSIHSLAWPNSSAITCCVWNERKHNQTQAVLYYNLNIANGSVMDFTFTLIAQGRWHSITSSHHRFQRILFPDF